MTPLQGTTTLSLSLEEEKKKLILHNFTLYC